MSSRVGAKQGWAKSDHKQLLGGKEFDLLGVSYCQTQQGVREQGSLDDTGFRASQRMGIWRLTGFLT